MCPRLSWARSRSWRACGTRRRPTRSSSSSSPATGTPLWAGRLRSTRRRGSASTSAVRTSTSSARTCAIPARTSSTTRWGRRCSLRMGKKRLIAETGAGQHGVAVATVAARFGLECTVYMGTEDMHRQSMNVRRIKLLNAEVCEVTTGTRTLKDATSEAIRDWVTNVGTTHYIIGSVVGPHPYPELVRDLQRVIGDEAREQYLQADGKLPDAVIACVGGGSNAIGMFTAFLDDKDVALVGVEAAGSGLQSGKHAASLVGGRPGVLHGTYSYLLQDGEGQVTPTHSISAGLDYPGVGPEHAFLRDSERVEYLAVTDQDAVAAFKLCTKLEGIMPALEPAHAIHHAGVIARELGPGGSILVCLSGRGDKDMDSVDAE